MKLNQVKTKAEDKKPSKDFERTHPLGMNFIISLIDLHFDPYYQFLKQYIFCRDLGPPKPKPTYSHLIIHYICIPFSLCQHHNHLQKHSRDKM